MRAKCAVDLTAEQRRHLLLVANAAPRARPRTRARILLLTDQGRTVGEIVAVLRTSPRTVARTRRKFVEGGVDSATADRPRPGAAPLLDERGRAALAALTIQAPPGARRGWSMQMLASELVRRGVVDRISDETVRRAIRRMRRS
ncbi:MAG TPA: helix-turn-helix domain-containing protein [Chloroflexota bacterium]|jgi:transposase|nr:helix-turn-helix domain-containing protein [Chloroflexota bacterium]